MSYVYFCFGYGKNAGNQENHNIVDYNLPFLAIKILRKNFSISKKVLLFLYSGLPCLLCKRFDMKIIFCNKIEISENWHP